MRKFLLCACSFAVMGNEAERLMKEHVLKHAGKYTQRVDTIRDPVTGKVYTQVVDDEEIIPNSQWQHEYAQFKEVQNEFVPVVNRDRDRGIIKRTYNYARTFEGNENYEKFDPIRDATKIFNNLKQQAHKGSFDRFMAYATCMNCDWMTTGQASGSFGAFHACGTRHRVIFYNSKANVLSLIPIPMRRCKPKPKGRARTITSGANEQPYAAIYTLRQQQKFPPDIDPYRHPVFRYARCPAEQHVYYKQWMREHADPNSIFPTEGWRDPYEAQYAALMSKTFVVEQHA